MKRLPDAEFMVMKAVWSLPPPCTAAQVLQWLQGGQDWKVQTVISLLSRLVVRGFLRTDKQGRERTYAPLIGQEEYLRFETSQFVRQYHEDSVASLVSTLYGGREISDEDAAQLMRWLQERKG